MSDFNTMLDILETAVAKGKSNEELNTLVENFTIPEQVTVQQLSRAYAILFPWFLKEPSNYYKDNAGRSLHWKGEKWFFQSLFDRFYQQRKWIREGIEGSIKRGETYKTEEEIAKKYNYPPEIESPFTAREAYVALSPYFNWMEKQLIINLDTHLTVVWNVLQKAKEPIKKAFIKWFKLLEEKQLVEPHFGENVAQAIDLYEFNDTAEFISTITKKDFDQWIILLDHPSPVLRGVAARCIGSVYTDWQDEDDEFQGHKYIPITDMLEMLYQKQVAGKNVVGGFIHGCDSDDIKKLEKHKILVAQQFDVKAWVLKTAIDSPETEPYTPGSQAFWFYVHEYLDYDPESVHKLIDGKRYWLAMMCATESLDCGSYKVMQPVLERLIKEAPQDIANETKRQIDIYH
jgi:hypothetical protein